MDYDVARGYIYTAVSNAAQLITPVPKLDWDNRSLVDEENEQGMIVSVEVSLTGGMQVGMGVSNTLKRTTGALILLVSVRQGTGVSVALSAANKLATSIEMRSLSGVVMQASTPQRAVAEKGWHRQPVAIPFWFDDLVST